MWEGGGKKSGATANFMTLQMFFATLPSVTWFNHSLILSKEKVSVTFPNMDCQWHLLTKCFLSVCRKLTSCEAEQALDLLA